VKYPKGNKGCSSKKVTQPTVQMKCLYTNAHNMGNKQEELEATMLLESYDLVWLSMATGGSEGTGGEGEVEALPSASRNG